MKIILISVGKTDDPFFSKIIEQYNRRVNFYIEFEIKTVPDVKNTKSLSEKEQKIQEGNSILKLLQPSDHIVLLDDKGKQYSSVEFAGFIEKRTHYVHKRLVFIAGGPYGFSQDMYDKANERFSLSKMTFTHQMVRLVFTEQLYRALTILNNEPYHHD
ncbi:MULTISPECIES: 23S rRNA (pseudouridine(1915)-N(3))-methyltransferase RlmH [Proteiniphilum]|uniref:23S rRNA (pseudouridine(1915)-N(3))-methyltransferase RlmH n=1 Tax=Proteiniphilum TaxID=294702 RepID=UPI001EEAF93A|nr:MULTISPECIES: 23S rRNA (pseudouridine(1915)-N(3))-methyltransferase RlmH [Proteiniphilum]ULB35760.1 23S rRNA (pseudouridine(1915)-N(3))-methyltransferase RlmH [Proteiniphilum propionicum]